MKPSASFRMEYMKYDHSRWEAIANGVIAEASVDLMVNGEFWISWMCTPTQLEALAIGFLFNEGVIQTFDEIALVRPCDDLTNVDVWLKCSVEKPAYWQRTSGCGSGVTRADHQKMPEPLPVRESVDPHALIGLMDQLLEAQVLYREVGGVHCAILTDGVEPRAVAEDIGRHNTLDKLAGQMLIENLPRDKWIIMTTGRVSSEMLQKSARIGAYLVVSRTSPSSLSIQLARQLGITLVGYARSQHFNVYSYPERLGLAKSSVKAQPSSD